MSATDTTTLRLERTFDASAEDVFDAWTNPEVLRRWWKVEPDGTVPIAEVDLREGGTYRLAMHNPASGETHTVNGRYIQVNRPELLEYTWAWVQQDGSVGHESTVRVRFQTDGDRTTVVLEHSGLQTPDSREKHGHGWSASLDSLGGIYAPGS
jgi:uncharacterized protein YndB with AHSA1/START domain